MAGTCPLPQRDENVKNYIATRLRYVEDSYDEVFGEDNRLTSMGQDLLQGELDNFERKIARLGLQILEEKRSEAPDRALIEELSNELNDAKKSKRITALQVRNYPKKQKYLDSIEKRIKTYLRDALDMSNYDSNYDPKLVMQMIKEAWIESKQGTVFYSLHELDPSTLASIDKFIKDQIDGPTGLRKMSENRVQSEILKQRFGEDYDPKKDKYRDKSLEEGNIFSYLFGNGSWGSFYNTIAHPLETASKFDPSGFAYKTLKAATDLAANAFSKRSSKEAVMSKVMDRLTSLADFSSSNPIMFLHDIGSRKIPDYSDTIKSVTNMFEFLTDVGRGGRRHIVPTPMRQRKADGTTVFTAQFNEDYEDYMRQINANAGNGIGAAGWIQKYTDENGKDHYYVLIKKKQVIDGVTKEYYRAYDAPIKWFDTKAGNKKLTIEKKPGKGNKEFWEQVYALRENGVGGYEQVSNDGKSSKWIPGRMPRGWYKAQDHESITGTINWAKDKRKVGQEFTMKSDTNFILDEDLMMDMDGKASWDAIPNELWRSLEDIRGVFKETYEDVRRTNQIHEERILENLIKLFPEIDFDKAFLGREDINGMLKQKYGFSVDTIDMNVAIRGGKIYTNNTDYDDLVNYWPIKYNDVAKLILFAESQKHLNEAIKGKKDKLTALRKLMDENPDNESFENDALIVENEISELTEVLMHEKLMLRYWAGEIDELPSFNQTTQIKSAKNRSKFTSPLPKTDDIRIPTGERDENGDMIFEEKKNVQTFPGMRKDAGVIRDYLRETYTAMEQNEVKITLLEALASGQMTEAMTDYVIDHVKSSFGRRDVKAGFLSIDYSDETLGIDEGGIVSYAVSLQNKLMSGSLLQSPNTSNMNNTQRIGMAGISSILDVFRVSRWNAKDDRNAARLDEAAGAAGLTDEIATITDVVMGNSIVRDDYFGSPFKGVMLKIHLLLQQADSSEAFLKLVKKNKVLGPAWLWLATRFAANTTDDTSQIQTTIDNFLMDTWEITVGLRKYGQKKLMKRETRLAIVKKLNRTYSEEITDQIIQFGFGGSFTQRVNPLAAARGVKAMNTFTESEKTMRKETLMIARDKLLNEGRLPSDWVGDNGETDLLYHPLVQRLARIMVNNVYFSMSRANLSKVFKGSVGELLTKFKPYQWNQLGAEYNIIKNWLNAVTNENTTSEEAAEIIKETFYKTNEDGLIEGLKAPRNQIENQVRNVLIPRAIASVVMQSAILFDKMFLLGGAGQVVGGVINKASQIMGYKGFNSLARGAESQMASSIIHSGIFWLALGMQLGADDEEKVYQNTMRHFLPVWFNVIYDTINEGHPLKFAELYGKTELKFINHLYEGLGLGGDD